MRGPTVALALLLATPLAAAAPEQIHLGIPTADGTTSRSFHWVELDLQAPVASVRLEGPNGTQELTATRVEGPSLGAVYEAVAEGLLPDTTYRYTIGEKSFEFRTPPTAPTRERPFRIVALGDMGVSSRAATTVGAIRELSPDLVLHAGDISYAEGRQNEWITWFQMVEPVAASVPWMTALGNHETYTVASPWALAQRPSEFEISFYKQRFGLPGNKIWYSFDVASVHIVALDTFSQRSISQDQLAWLEQDLQRPSNWTIALLHEPPYSSNDNHGSSQRAQDAFSPILGPGGVDLVLAAHDHSYERTHPIDNVTYVVTGGGGQSLYRNWVQPAPNWSAAREAAYHIVVLDVYKDRIEGRAVPTQTGSLNDTFVITRDVPPEVEAPAAIGTPGPAIAVALVAIALAARAFGSARRR